MAPGRTTIIATDCAQVAQAMSRGSPSPVLQQHSACVAWLAAESESRLVPLWFQGKEMVDIGVDNLSRAVAKSLHDVSLSSSAFSLVCSLAEAYLGGQPTVDWFASAATAQLPRFWTRFHYPTAEGCYAFLAHSWQ
eukprot:3937032-Rhodomonas_salina.3